MRRYDRKRRKTDRRKFAAGAFDVEPRERDMPHDALVGVDRDQRQHEIAVAAQVLDQFRFGFDGRLESARSNARTASASAAVSGRIE